MLAAPLQHQEQQQQQQGQMLLLLLLLLMLTQQMLGWLLGLALLLLGRQCWLVLTPTGLALAALAAQQPAPTRQQQPALPQQALSTVARQWAVHLTAQALQV